MLCNFELSITSKNKQVVSLSRFKLDEMNSNLYKYFKKQRILFLNTLEPRLNTFKSFIMLY